MFIISFYHSRDSGNYRIGRKRLPCMRMSEGVPASGGEFIISNVFEMWNSRLHSPSLIKTRIILQWDRDGEAFGERERTVIVSSRRKRNLYLWQHGRLSVSYCCDYWVSTTSTTIAQTNIFICEYDYGERYSSERKGHVWYNVGGGRVGKRIGARVRRVKVRVGRVNLTRVTRSDRQTSRRVCPSGRLVWPKWSCHCRANPGTTPSVRFGSTSSAAWVSNSANVIFDLWNLESIELPYLLVAEELPQRQQALATVDRRPLRGHIVTCESINDFISMKFHSLFIFSVVFHPVYKIIELICSSKEVMSSFRRQNYLVHTF